MEAMISDFQYEGLRRIVYVGGATFVPVCEKCGRFVRSDEKIIINGLEELVRQPNATCKRCGRVEMLFEGFF